MTPCVIISSDKEIIELAMELSRFKLVGILDPRADASALGIPVLGIDRDWPRIKGELPGLKVILAVDPTGLKERLANHFGFENLLTLISSDSYISPSAVVSNGSLVQRGVKIMSEASIGTACKINVGATVHHDSRVGDFCTLAPGCQLLGSVILGNRVFVGAGAIILPKVRVGEDVVVGAGAVVVSDVPPGTTVVGVPAHSLNKRES